MRRVEWKQDFGERKRERPKSVNHGTPANNKLLPKDLMCLEEEIKSHTRQVESGERVCHCKSCPVALARGRLVHMTAGAEHFGWWRTDG